MNIGKELRVMHACEVGATGVYRGHKCVARYFFRSSLPELDSMRLHERGHTAMFLELLSQHNARPCYAYRLFFTGGLLYGVLVGMLGLKAIGTSTATIEEIVIRELDIVLAELQDDAQICNALRTIQQEEQQHQVSGVELSGSAHFLQKYIRSIAKAGAYTAKYLAQHL